MGQSNWAWGCALFLSATFGMYVVAQEPADPFGDVGQKRDAAAEPKTVRDGGLYRGHSPEDARQRIEGVLNQGLKQPLDFIEQPLRDVVTILSETYDIPILFDVSALDAVAASPDVEVSIQINNVTLRSALDLMLKNAGAEALTYIIDNEVLLITTLEESETRLEVVVYRVDDLIADPAAAEFASSAADVDTLIDVIVSSVEHESWQVNNTGEGEIHAFPPGMIVVSQTHRVHEQVQRLLANLRKNIAEVEAAAAGKREIAARSPVTRAIRVHDASFAAPENRKVLQHALLQSVDWKPDGEDVSESDLFLHVLPDRVLVRHIPHVIGQVELAVREISVPMPGFGGGAGGGGRGGRGGGF